MARTHDRKFSKASVVNEGNRAMIQRWRMECGVVDKAQQKEGKASQELRKTNADASRYGEKAGMKCCFIALTIIRLIDARSGS